jgi:hypothetical protein
MYLSDKRQDGTVIEIATVIVEAGIDVFERWVGRDKDDEARAGDTDTSFIGDFAYPMFRSMIASYLYSFRKVRNR